MNTPITDLFIFPAPRGYFVLCTGEQSILRYFEHPIHGDKGIQQQLMDAARLAPMQFIEGLIDVGYEEKAFELSDALFNMARAIRTLMSGNASVQKSTSAPSMPRLVQ